MGLTIFLQLFLVHKFVSLATISTDLTQILYEPISVVNFMEKTNMFFYEKKKNLFSLESILKCFVQNFGYLSNTTTILKQKFFRLIIFDKIKKKKREHFVL